MTKYKGKDGSITVGSSPVGEVKSFTVSVKANEQDVSVMGSDWKDTEATQKSWSASVVAFWDKADVGQLALDVGDTVAISLFPASGSHLTGNALVTSSQISSTVDGIIDYTLELMGKGALTKTGM